MFIIDCLWQNIQLLSKQVNSAGIDSYERPSYRTKIGFKSSIFGLRDRDLWTLALIFCLVAAKKLNEC